MLRLLPVDVLNQPLLAPAQLHLLVGLLDVDFQFGQVEGFGQVVVGALLHGGDRRLHAAVGGQEQRLQVGLPHLEPLQQLQAIHAWHVQVEHGHVKAGVGRDPQGLLAARGGVHGHPLALEAADQGATHLLVVVHDQEADRRAWGVVGHGFGGSFSKGAAVRRSVARGGR